MAVPDVMGIDRSNPTIPGEKDASAISSDLPPNVDIISWVDGGPALRYSDLSSQQKQNLIEVFHGVGSALDIHWSQVRLLGRVTEKVQMVNPDKPNREQPPLHPTYVIRNASEEVTGQKVIGPPGLSFSGIWHQGNWISVSEDTLIDCSDIQ